jgi:hypothetical protein
MNEQNKLISLLKGPVNYAHQSGKEMVEVLNQGKRKRHKSMLKTADRHILIISEIFDEEQVVRILKTWLCVYQLPLAPSRLKTFEQFHRRFFDFILQNTNSLRSY